MRRLLLLLLCATITAAAAVVVVRYNCTGAIPPLVAPSTLAFVLQNLGNPAYGAQPFALPAADAQGGLLYYALNLSVAALNSK